MGRQRLEGEREHDKACGHHKNHTFYKHTRSSSVAEMKDEKAKIQQIKIYLRCIVNLDDA